MNLRQEPFHSYPVRSGDVGRSHVLDPYALKEEFPILRQEINGKPLVYFDNAATTQKPRAVLERLRYYYERENANIHRGVHTLSGRATDAYEAGREAVRLFIGARESKEIVFVRGASEGINLVAQTYGRKFIGKGDEILVSAMEHHSNIVPWQMLCEQTGARLKVAPMNRRGELDLQAYGNLLNKKTKIVALVHVSNALGTVNPVKEMIAQAHKRGIPVLVDGAQSVPHMPVDVQDMDCDFFVFSGHKMYAPTGIGVLYGKKALLEEMPPYQGGGDMIRSVSFSHTTYNTLPHKFEAGTPNIAGVVGLAAAVDFLGQIGMSHIAAHEADLLQYATLRLLELDGFTIFGNAEEKAAVISFLYGHTHPHDIGTILDNEGIAIRTGHHCAQPVMEYFGIPATARASFALYNSRQEIDRLVDALQKIEEVFH